MNEFQSNTIGEFLTQLSSKEPTPGGGAAAALVGATAASLCCMVANIFSNKIKNTIDQTSRNYTKLLKLKNEAEYQRNKLLRLMDADAKAYQRLIESYTLPKGYPKRAQYIGDNVEQVALVASDIACCCYNVLVIARGLQTYALGSLGLDADCAETMAISGFEGASGLVYGNLSHTGNDALNEVLANKMAQLREKV